MMADTSWESTVTVLSPEESERLGAECVLREALSVNVRLAAGGLEAALVEFPNNPPAAPVAAMSEVASEADVQART